MLFLSCLNGSGFSKINLLLIHFCCFVGTERGSRGQVQSSCGDDKTRALSLGPVSDGPSPGPPALKRDKHSQGGGASVNRPSSHYINTIPFLKKPPA